MHTCNLRWRGEDLGVFESDMAGDVDLPERLTAEAAMAAAVAMGARLRKGEAMTPRERAEQIIRDVLAGPHDMIHAATVEKVKSAIAEAVREALENNAEKPEKCEGCGRTDIYKHDAEGVPLCTTCHDELEAETKAADDAGELSGDDFPDPSDAQMLEASRAALDQWATKLVQDQSLVHDAIACKGIVDCTGETPVVRKVRAHEFRHGSHGFIVEHDHVPKPGDAPACVSCGAATVGMGETWACLVCGARFARAGKAGGA